MRIRWATALALAVGTAAAACGGGSSAGRAGLHGVAMRGPTSPVCRAGVPCEKPAAKALLLFTRSGGPTVRVRTDGRGRYQAWLAPGIYRVGVPRREGVAVAPSRTAVVAGRTRRVDLHIDTGIR